MKHRPRATQLHANAVYLVRLIFSVVLVDEVQIALKNLLTGCSFL